MCTAGAHWQVVLTATLSLYLPLSASVQVGVCVVGIGIGHCASTPLHRLWRTDKLC